MRRSLVSVALSLLIFVLCAGAALWLLRRGDRDPAGGGRDGAEVASLDGERTPGAGPSGGAGTEGPGEASEPGGDEGAADPALDVPEAAISIEGRVTDAAGNGVADARVAAVARRSLEETIEKDKELLDRAPLDALRAFRGSLGELAKRLPACATSADGAYVLRGLPDGEHRVVVTHPEFLTHAAEGWVLVEAGKPARHDVELVAGQTISGVARDAEGRPVAGARVRATPVEVSRLKGLGQLVQVFLDHAEGAVLREASPVETDPGGAFRLTSLEPGAYDLRLAKDGYAWGVARGVPSGTQGLRVLLGPAIGVAGRVVAPGGDPVGRAEVLLREPELDIHGPEGPMAFAFAEVDVFREKARAATTDEEGRFALDAFCPGPYELIVRAEGYAELARPAPLDGASVDLGDIVLAAPWGVSGTVLSPDGGPVEGAEVWVPEAPARREDADSRRLTVLSEGPASAVRRAVTDRRGSFSLGGLAGGSHEVAVLADGYPGEVLGDVIPGGPGLTVTLQRGLTVRGRVLDAETGDPLPGAKVDIVWTPNVGTSGADGRFELRGVRRPSDQASGGTFPVRAALEGFREAQQTVAFPDPSAVPVAEATLELRRIGGDDPERGVRGVVRDARGEPIADALVWVEVPGVPRTFIRMGTGGRADEGRTGADGTFALPVPRFGGTTFEVVASKPGLAVSRAGPYPQDPAEGGHPWVEIRLGEGASVEGRVSGPDGAPVAGARVRIRRDAQVPEESTIFTQLLPQAEGSIAYSSQDGTYRLRRIEPGSYRVECRAQGFAAKALGPVEVLAGASPTRIDVALDAGGTLAGRAVDPDGVPLPGIEVVAIPILESSPPSPEDEDELVQTGALGVATSTTGADGSYELGHLPEGTFLVLGRARGFQPAWIPSVRPGESLPDLVMARHARIVGRVRDADTGSAIPSFHVSVDRRQPDGEYREDHRKARDVDDAEGRFAIEGLRPAEWRVRVASRDRVAWRKDLGLGPGEQAELDVALSSGGRIAGSVRRADGAPIAGATIHGRIETEPRPGERRDLEPTRSGADGGFAFGGLEDGAYRVVASHPDYSCEESEGTAGVSVAAGEAPPATLVLRPAGRIVGRIRGLVFTPPGIDIWVVTFIPIAGDSGERGGRGRRRTDPPDPDPKPGPAYQCWADAQGTFQQDSLRPGRYRLELVHRRRGPDTGDDWITVPPETRPLGEVEIRELEMSTFEGDAP